MDEVFETRRSERYLRLAIRRRKRAPRETATRPTGAVLVAPDGSVAATGRHKRSSGTNRRPTPCERGADACHSCTLALPCSRMIRQRPAGPMCMTAMIRVDFPSWYAHGGARDGADSPGSRERAGEGAPIVVSGVHAD